MLPPDMQNYVTCWCHEEGTTGWLVTQIKSSHGLLFWAMFEHFEIHSLVLCKYYETNKYFPDRPRRSQTWHNSADVSWSQWGFFMSLSWKTFKPSIFFPNHLSDSRLPAVSGWWPSLSFLESDQTINEHKYVLGLLFAKIAAHYSN